MSFNLIIYSHFQILPWVRKTSGLIRTSIPYNDPLIWSNSSNKPTTTTVKTISLPSPWSEWSQCSVTCGHGTQIRSRRGGETQRKICKISSCPSWSSWSPCSVSCGRGQKSRTSSSGDVDVRSCKFRECKSGKIILILPRSSHVCYMAYVNTNTQNWLLEIFYDDVFLL